VREAASKIRKSRFGATLSNSSGYKIHTGRKGEKEGKMRIESVLGERDDRTFFARIER